MLAMLAAAAVVQAAPAPPIPKNDCTPPESCRYVADFTLANDGGEEKVKAGFWMPYLHEGALVVMPGETLVLKLRKEAGGLQPVVVSGGRADRVVKDERDAVTEREVVELNTTDEEQVRTVHRPGGVAAVRADEDTVRITFEQVEGKTDMILRVDNGYGRTLDYGAVLIRAGANRREHTTVCLVKPGVINFEAWPYPIASIELSAFRFVDSPEELELAHCD